jgi:hypothetical protein
MSTISTSAKKPQRCGRCRWWEGNRFRNKASQTVSFSVEGKCGNLHAPAEWANTKVHYLAGADCPVYEVWESPDPDKVDGELHPFARA